jgi:phosphatidylserine/phosphatidylglycerophosphate/cardiolipin synthase-like enzyme
LVTSANFTQAAQEKNIEVGVLVRDPGFVGRLAGYFDGLLAGALLQRCLLE